MELDEQSANLRNIPVAVNLDLDELLPGTEADSSTIEVHCAGTAVPHRLSDEFRYGNSGTIYFVASDPAQWTYRIHVSDRDQSFTHQF